MPVKNLTEGFLPYVNRLKKQGFNSILLNILKWMFFFTLIGTTVGSASALFLATLNWATNFRESHLWIIAFLPLAGLTIGFSYHYWGKDVVKGNNLLIE
jgi:H+/Cl- antiporter ClcA